MRKTSKRLKSEICNKINVLIDFLESCEIRSLTLNTFNFIYLDTDFLNLFR